MSSLAIIGGGVAGLAAAEMLSGHGHQVTVFEKLGRLGGLARTFKIADTRLECFYHHIFSSDHHVTGLMEKIGVSDKLLWRTSPMGFFAEGKIWNFGGPLDLLKYQPLSFSDRVKFGLMALYLQKRNDWRYLENYTVEEYVSGNWKAPSLYTKVWEPLLKRKFGPGFETTSAAWLWGRINPRAKSRSAGGTKEQLGYMVGSFETFLEALAAYVKKQGVTLYTGHTVSKITREENGSFTLTLPELGDQTFDAVIYTGSNDVFCEIAPQLPQEYQNFLTSVRYQGCICLTLELTRSLSPIYWLNIADPDINFGGIIEQTDRKSTRLNSSHTDISRMPSSA